jgi:hypothetical protein
MPIGREEPGGLRAALYALAFMTVTARVATADPAVNGEIGFVVTSWYTALHETADGKEECPDGLAQGTQEIYIAGLLAGERERLSQATNGGAIDLDDPMVPVSALRQKALERGPGGKDVCWNPDSVQDPPMHIVRGGKSYGLNLDGTPDGRPTANSCGHQKFTDLDGQPGVDNQWYRLIGCAYGWRSSGYMETNANGELKDSGHAILIGLENAGDLRDAPNVRVTFYRARDLLPKDSTGGILPYSSYRAFEDYKFEATGRIVNGELTTDPIDIRIPFYANLTHAEYYLKAMRLKLDLQPNGSAAKGLVAGYYDFDSLWNYISKLGYETVAGRFDCPALYQAAHQLADGYPDPKTGKCTALSSAFRIEAIPAFIIHHDGIAPTKAASVQPTSDEARD